MREGEGNAGDAARYHRVKQIVLQALDLQGSAREELIVREAGGDATIADEVRALLAGMEADQTLVVSLPLARAAAARSGGRTSAARRHRPTPAASTACCSAWAPAAWAWCTWPNAATAASCRRSR
ncbi:hypothetical protein [Stenotrophomonas acidaminiphila]|uniref:hypothetical protein n=1 Tax=Stenotrophomonas acidaminiphila TaxID=128780 RepID=UPI001E2C3283|nr:hypothetical protein [Stenotrophomonas acidaminiphila]